MNASNELLSQIVAYRTYAKYLPNLARRESLEESINRCMIMHLDKFPKLSKDIVKAFQKVHSLKIMPSMRSLQFAGDAVSKNNVRQYNCSYTPIDTVRTFSEILFILLSGAGVGYSVQKTHIDKLPVVGKPRQEGKYLVQDSIHGWSQALHSLMEAYYYNGVRPNFDFTNVSPKGTYLFTTGAKAPGAEPLKVMLAEVEKRLTMAVGRKLKSIELHDIICIISDCVLAGGIRRAALISLFDRDDTDMLKSKSGEWWVKHPYRARANNSAVLPRKEVSKDEFFHIFDICKNSGSGEPGFSWTDNPDWGFNPCFTGDTLVAVADGRNAVSIKQLADENWTGPVYTMNNGAVTVGNCSKVWKTRKNSNLIRVTLDNNTSIRCTPDHKFMLRNGNYVKAKDLIPGTSLMPFNSFKRKDRNYRMISSNQGRDTAQYRFVAMYYDLIKEGELKQHIHHKDGDGLNDYVSNLEVINAQEHNREHRLGSQNPIHKFKNNKNYKEKRKACTTGNNNPRSRGVTGEEMFTVLCAETLRHDRILTHAEALKICGVKFVSKGRLKEMGAESFKEARSRAHSLMNHKVVSVEALSQKEDVYDLTVDVTHNFAVISQTEDKNFINSSGVFVHNCHEISLQPKQFCNLTTVNQTGIKDKKDFLSRIYSATLIGTIQAAYTDFPYLSPEWKHTTEKESLLGVSFTGIADAAGIVSPEWLAEGAKLALEVNDKYSKKIGINPAARLGALKPEGTCSTVVGSSSGIHARHSADWYLRRIRMSKNDSLATYLMNTIPDLCEDDVSSANTIVVTIPQESPEGALGREGETAMDLFKRAMMYNTDWVATTHRSGDNKHNVSCTISVKNHEWDGIRDAMWKNKNSYSGISLLPYENSSYKQMPFETCDQDTYDKYSKLVKNIDLKEVKEFEDNTNRMEIIACAGGTCDLNV